MKLTLFLLVLFIVMFTYYYTKILQVKPGENKNLQLFKNAVSLIITISLLYVYNNTTDNNLKSIFIVILVVISNIYLVIRSTRKCNFKRIYVIQLSLYSVAITLLLASILWYSTYGNVFGFEIIDNKSKEDIRQIFYNEFRGGMFEDMFKKEEE